MPDPTAADRISDKDPREASGKSRARHATRFLTALLVLCIAVVTLASAWTRATAAAGSTSRVAPTYDPPVLAGQMAWTPWCSGGVYARRGDVIVLTSSGHCAPEGTTLYDDDGSVAGVWGSISDAATCAHQGYRCTASDMNYLIVAPDRIPWGHLNEIDMGAGGYRVASPGLKPLECDEVGVNDEVEFDGRAIYRTGHVIGQREYLPPVTLDPIYFPCIVIADIHVATGDSGGVVLVQGIPSGIASRRFGDLLGFTPLGSGLAELGLSICETANCGLAPP